MDGNVVAVGREQAMAALKILDLMDLCGCQIQDFTTFFGLMGLQVQDDLGFGVALPYFPPSRAKKSLMS